MTFASVAQQPSQGSCSIQSSGALLTCSIGTLAVGQSVAIKVNATVTQTGTITNTGTTTTTTPETNPPTTRIRLRRSWSHRPSRR